MESVEGCGRPASGTLVSTTPTVAPGPAMVTLEFMDAGEASWAQRKPAWPEERLDFVRRNLARAGCLAEAFGFDAS